MEKNDLRKSMELISQFNNREACRQIHDILSDILNKYSRKDTESKKNKDVSVEGDGLYFRDIVQGPSNKDEFKKAGAITCKTVTLTPSDADLIIAFADFPHETTDTREDPSSHLESDISPLHLYPSDKLDETVILEIKNTSDVGFEHHKVNKKPNKESEKTHIPLDVHGDDLEKTVIIRRAQGLKKETNASEIMENEGRENRIGEFGWNENDLEKTVIIASTKNRLEKEILSGQEVGDPGGLVRPETSGQRMNEQLENGDNHSSWDDKDIDKTVIISSRDVKNSQIILDDERKNEGEGYQPLDSWDDKDLDKTMITSSRDAKNSQIILDDEKKDEGYESLDNWDEDTLDMTMILRTDENNK